MSSSRVSSRAPRKWTAGLFHQRNASILSIHASGRTGREVMYPQLTRRMAAADEPISRRPVLKLVRLACSSLPHSNLELQTSDAGNAENNLWNPSVQLGGQAPAVFPLARLPKLDQPTTLVVHHPHVQNTVSVDYTRLRARSEAPCVHKLER